MEIGVCTSFDKLYILQESKCSFIEVPIQDFFMPNKSDAEFEVNLQKAKQAALPIISGINFYPGSMKLVGPDMNTTKILDYTEVVMKRAKMVGTKTLVLGSGGARRIPEGFDYEKAEKQFVELCKQIGIIAQKYDVVVVVEPLRKEETNLVNTLREGLKIVKSVNHPNIKLLADLYHMACEKEDPEVIIEAGEELKHCHIAEVTERTAPGVKGDDFTPYFKALKKINYKGGISMECRWKNFDKEVLDGVSEIRRQMKSLVN